MLLKKIVPTFVSILIFLLALATRERQLGDSLLFEMLTRFGDSLEGMTVRQVRDLLVPLAKPGSIQEWHYANGAVWVVWEWSEAAKRYLAPVRSDGPPINNNAISFEGEKLTSVRLRLRLPLEEIVRVFGPPAELYPNGIEPGWFTSTYLIYRVHYKEFLANIYCCGKTLSQKPLVVEYSKVFAQDGRMPFEGIASGHSWDDYKVHWDWRDNDQFGPATPTP